MVEERNGKGRERGVKEREEEGRGEEEKRVEEGGEERRWVEMFGIRQS